MKTNHYQCVNCQLNFDVEADYISHYKSEHHRYNIKRKLIGLPPLSFEEYHLRKFKDYAEFEDEKTSKHSVAQDFYCEICSKKFMNAGTYKQHLSSKKHQQNRDKLKTPGQYTLSKSSSSSDFQIIGAEKAVLCLFCQSEGTLKHMRHQHNFPPFETECINYEGLFNYVKQKIAKLECIFCHLKFNSEESVRQHMKDTSHTRLDADNFGQYEKFYLWTIQETETQQQPALEEITEDMENSAHLEELAHPTLKDLQRKRLERIQLTNTGAIINGKQVGYRHLRQYYKQYLNREIINLREKYQPALEMGKPQWKNSTQFFGKYPKICAASSGR